MSAREYRLLWVVLVGVLANIADGLYRLLNGLL